MEAGATALGGSLGFAGAFMAGAAGSVASQVVGMAMGNVKEFDWKSVAMSGLSAGIGTEIGALAESSSLSVFKDSVVARAMISSTLSQGIGVATGLQNSFSWRSVAAAGAGAYVGDKVGGFLKEQNLLNMGKGYEYMTALARGTVIGFASGVTASVLRAGRVDVQQVAADAFGNALGSSLAEKSSGEEKQAKPTMPNGQDVALNGAANIRQVASLSTEQDLKLSQLEADIKSGKRSLEFATGSDNDLRTADGNVANAKQLYGKDKVLVSSELVNSAMTSENNARRLAVVYEETSGWIADNIGLKLENGGGGFADIGAALGKVGVRELIQGLRGSGTDKTTFNLTFDGIERGYTTDRNSLEFIDRSVFTTERILRGDRDKYGEFQRSSYSFGTNPDWNKNLTNEQSNRVIEAICKARTPGARTPTFTEIAVLGQNLSGDFSKETISNQNRYRTFQAVFNQEFIKSGSDWLGYTPIDPQLRPEVTYRLDNGEMTSPVLSLTRFNEYGNAEPGSILRSLQVGREVGRGNTVRWDMTVVADPSKPLTWSNVSDVLEFKFYDDGFTENQARYARTPAIMSKLKIINSEDFAYDCNAREQESRQRVNSAVKQSAELFNKLILPLLGPRSGPRSPVH
jgi:hypothetical protein